MKPDDGGYAFPQEWSTFKDADYGGGQTRTYNHVNGISLRAWFAGKALSGAVIVHTNPIPADIAKWAFRIADAMLAEANKKGDQ